MRVLFVDDTLDTRQLYALIMTMEGFQVQTAADGVEAVDAVREAQQPFEVVVLDVGMPRMNGWEALAAIRQLPLGEDVPVIMFSAHVDDLRFRAKKAGANDTLDKPAAPAQLVDKIRSAVKQYP